MSTESAELGSVDERVREIIDQCLKKEIELLKVNANERSITHKVAEYLQGNFRKDGYDVDCEYNRDGYRTKKLQLVPRRIDSDEEDGETVFPDIIVHKRGTNDHNLVVIEAKKSTNNDRGNDLKKLRAFKRELRYRLCYRLIVYVGKNVKPERLFELTRK